MTDLTALANQLGTDKGTAGTNHCYTTFYESIFCDLRDKPIRLLEIGVLNGGSLAMWEAYFPQATIVGLDIDVNQMSAPPGPRSVVLQCDAGDPATLAGVGQQCGPFDIVIDDGSHEMAHQMLAAQVLLPQVNPGGWLVIEDVLADHATHLWAETLMRAGGYASGSLLASVFLVQSLTTRERFMAAFRRLA